MKVLNIEQITAISEDSIKYNDSEGKEQTISLSECNDNWIDYFNLNIDDFLMWDGSPAEKKNKGNCKCVGQRDWFADKPYFEFFFKEIVRFVIAPKRKLSDIFNKHWRQKYYKDFYNVTKLLHNAGWTTFDLG